MSHLAVLRPKRHRTPNRCCPALVRGVRRITGYATYAYTFRRRLGANSNSIIQVGRCGCVEKWLQHPTQISPTPTCANLGAATQTPEIKDEANAGLSGKQDRPGSLQPFTRLRQRIYNGWLKFADQKNSRRCFKRWLGCNCPVQRFKTSRERDKFYPR